MIGTVMMLPPCRRLGVDAAGEHAARADRGPDRGHARSTIILVGTVVASAIGVNIVAADQYLSVVPPGRTFKREFERRGLPPRLLSRTLGDSEASDLSCWNL
jgi:hypothetical protein